MRTLVACALLVYSSSLMAAQFEVALTVDDLPVHMDLPPGKTRLDVANEFLATLKKHHIKNVYGFVVAGRIKGDKVNYSVLKTWVHGGQLLGNHTYGHVNLDKVTANQFIHQIQMDEPYLTKLMGKKDYHYFRYPYLHEGETLDKRNAVRHFLFANNYKIAQVTMDFEDYLWNNPYARCVKKGDRASIEWLKKSYLKNALNSITVAHQLSMSIFHRDIKNILLVHIGAFDAQMLDQVLTAFEKRGVKIILLKEALQDKVYSINPNIANINTDTFYTQMRMAKKIPMPEQTKQLLESIPEDKLNALCR